MLRTRLHFGIRNALQCCSRTQLSNFSFSSQQHYIPTPYVHESVGGGWHSYDIFSRLLKERIICLNGPVHDGLSATIVAQLLFLEGESPDKPISLYINSGGGSVTAGLAIYDTINYIRSPVSTICVGQAASMASLLLAGGAPGKRYALPHSSIMVHQPSGGYTGQASDIAIHAKEILRVRERLNRIYKKHLTKPHSLAEIEQIMERDLFMSAEDAKDMGLVDEILEARKPAEQVHATPEEETRTHIVSGTQEKPEAEPQKCK